MLNEEGIVEVSGALAALAEASETGFLLVAYEPGGHHVRLASIPSVPTERIAEILRAVAEQLPVFERATLLIPGKVLS